GGRHRPGGHAAGVKGNGSKDLGDEKGHDNGGQIPRHHQPENGNPGHHPHHGQTDGNRHADGEAGAHGLAGNGAGGDLLHLLVQNMDRRLRLDDEPAHQHSDGNQDPVEGQAGDLAAEVAGRRHEA
ncbi:DUF4348 domain-containing protein, partial [Dysosmobacter welbionis]